jgi:hypothetical protein
MGQSRLVVVRNPQSAYHDLQGWLPNHGIVNLVPGELYELQLKGNKEKVKIDGSNLAWVIHKFNIMALLEACALSVIGAEQDHTFSERQMRYAHQFIDVLLPLWTKLQNEAERTGITLCM